MAEEFVARSLHDLFDSLGPRLHEETLLVDPSAGVLRGYLKWGAADSTDAVETRLLAREATLKETLRSFPAASLAADLVEADRLAMRYEADPPLSAVLLDSEILFAILEAQNLFGALATTDQPFVGDVYERCSSRFDAADGYVLHTPGRQRILETLEDRLGADRRETFERYLEAMDPADPPFDEVVLSLLVAAKHRDLLYDVSKWGEDVGLASKATFSRKKSALTDADLIDTEAEPINVGRPRLRLKLADPELDRASPAELVATATSALADDR